MNIEEIILIIVSITFIVISLIFRKNGDYFLGLKDNGVIKTTLSLTASWIGVTSILFVSNSIFELGHAAIWYLISPSIFLILLGLFGTKKIRAIKGVQIGDYFENKKIKNITIIFISIIYILVLGVQIIGFATVSLGFNVTYTFGLILSCVVIIIYIGLGGFNAVSTTDILQALLIFLTIIGLFLITPLKLDDVNFKNALNPINLNTKWSSLFIIQGLVMIVAQENHQRIKASKNNRVASISTVLSGVIIFIFTISIYLITVSIGQHEPNPLLFKISQQSTSLKILFSVGFLGAALSTADTALNISSYSISSLVNPNNKKIVMWIIIIFTTLISGVIALFIPSIKTIILIAINLYIGVLLPITLLKLLNLKGKVLSITLTSCLVSFIGAMFFIPIISGLISLGVGVIIILTYYLFNSISK
jgi:Na+/proline symporter